MKRMLILFFLVLLSFNSYAGTWTSLGDIGTGISSLAVHDGNLYTLQNGLGTYNSASRVWTSLVPKGYTGYPTTALASYDGNLFVGSSGLGGPGDANVLGSYDNITGIWTEGILQGYEIEDLVVYDGNLYASVNPNWRHPEYGGLLTYDGKVWTRVVNSFFNVLAVYDGNLFTGNEDGVFGTYNAASGIWANLGDKGSAIRSLAVYDGNLYAGQYGHIGTYKNGIWSSLTWRESQYWNFNNFLTVYDGNLYIGTGEDYSEVWTYDSTSNIFSVAFNFYRQSAFAVYDGNIYTGTTQGVLGTYYNEPFSIIITSPTMNSSFYPSQDMNVQFAVNSSGNDFAETGLSQIQYKLKDPDSWTAKNATQIGTGTYSFSVQAPSTDGNYSFSIRAQINGNYIQNKINYRVARGDLYIESIKPIQVVEDVNLVTDKATVVRVKVKNTGNPATVRTKLTYNGQDYNITEPISDSNTLDFYPSPYSTPGKYQITAIVDDANQIPETNENNNTKTVDVNVINTDRLRVAFFRYDYPNLDKYLNDVNTLSTFLLDTYPIAKNKLEIVPVKTPFDPGLTSIGCVLPWWCPSLVLSALDTQINSGHLNVDRGILVVPKGWLANHFYYSEGGFTVPHTKSALLEYSSLASGVAAHELGHTYNLCDEYKQSVWIDENNQLSSVGGCGNPFPNNCFGAGSDPESCIGNMDINGFSVRKNDSRKTGEPSNQFNGFVVSWHSFMGDADSFSWASKESYTQILKKLDPNGPIDPQIILIRGIIDANGDISFYDFYLTDGYPYGITDGNYTIELKDSNNGVIRDVNFGPPFLGDLNWGKDINTTAFDFAIDYNSNIHKIVGKYGGNVKVERIVSSVAPTVTVVYPKQGDVWTDTNSIQWSANDSDSNNLSYSLLYTFDNGASWYPIALDVTDKNYTWSVKEVDPKNTYKIKVIATDGVLTGDNNSGTFTIKAPNIELSPYLWDIGRQAKGRILESNFTITNSGNADLNLFSINSSPTIDIAGISFPLTLQPNESQTFTATIDILPILGGYSGDINISSNDPNESIKTIFVDGNIQQVSPQISVAVSAPYEINYPNSFSLNALVTTQNSPLRDANITIHLPQGLSTANPLTVNLGNIFESSSNNASWNINTSQAGLFEIVLTVSSINNADFNETVLVNVTRIGVSDISTDKNAYYLTERVRIYPVITNFNSGVTYTNLDINSVITDSQDNNTNLHNHITTLFAGDTQTLFNYWDKGNKMSGNYKVTTYLYDSNRQLLDSNVTTFEVLSPTIDWIVGYGGKKVIGPDYNITYSILPRPVKKIISVDYNLFIGWKYYSS